MVTEDWRNYVRIIQSSLLTIAIENDTTDGIDAILVASKPTKKIVIMEDFNHCWNGWWQTKIAYKVGLKRQ